MFVVPIYFQVTKRASTGEAGAFLIPAVIGNAIGGLLTGIWIKRYVLISIVFKQTLTYQKTGGYKSPTVLASASSTLSFVLLLLLWRGNTSAVESFVILPAGLPSKCRSQLCLWG